jgi:hypothetical protein
MKTLSYHNTTVMLFLNFYSMLLMTYLIISYCENVYQNYSICLFIPVPLHSHLLHVYLNYSFLFYNYNEETSICEQDLFL